MAGVDDGACRLGAFFVPAWAGVSALFCPATVAIHDDANVLGVWSFCGFAVHSLAVEKDSGENRMGLVLWQGVIGWAAFCIVCGSIRRCSQLLLLVARWH